MNLISRRHFLQFSGSTLATLGFSQLDIQRQAAVYGKVLAQNTPRKLALLVGINNYPSKPLQGCLNDVELQRYLLTYRFGFNSQDIHTLTDEKATRTGILEAFEEHLIHQAKPGDVVVFHYSGHGSRVFDPDTRNFGLGDDQSGLTSTFVPVDSWLPTGYPEKGGVVKDILGHTLFLLMLALPTENFTAVLDSCYSGGVRKFRTRWRDGGEKLQISPEEMSYQEKWLSRLKLSRKELVGQYRQGFSKGVVLEATKREQTAADAHFSGFDAGAFTYLLTQYLWQQTSTVESAIAHVNQNMPQEYGQTPRADGSSGYAKQPIYFSNPSSQKADAVITEVKGNQATLWLGGLDKQSLEALDEGVVLAIAGAQGGNSGKVKLKSRDGLVGEGILEGVAAKGALLRKLG